MSALLLVDLSNQTYRSAHVNRDLKASDGLFTGGLYGFLMVLAKCIRDMEITQVVVAEDRPPYRRSDLYPEYKLIRKTQKDPELKAKVDLSMVHIKKALDVIGIPVVGVDGFESDDIISHFVRRYYGRFDKIVAAANDSDLFQLLAYRRFCIVTKSDTLPMTLNRLKRMKGMTPEQHTMMTALMGTHNDVAGIPGVGEGYATKAVLHDPERLAKYQREHAQLIARNLRLIKLPYEGFPSDLRLPSSQTYTSRTLYRFLARYNIQATKSMLDSFTQVCP